MTGVLLLAGFLSGSLGFLFQGDGVGENMSQETAVRLSLTSFTYVYRWCRYQKFSRDSDPLVNLYATNSGWPPEVVGVHSVSHEPKEVPLVFDHHERQLQFLEKRHRIFRSSCPHIACEVALPAGEHFEHVVNVRQEPSAHDFFSQFLLPCVKPVRQPKGIGMREVWRVKAVISQKPPKLAISSKASNFNALKRKHIPEAVVVLLQLRGRNEEERLKEEVDVFQHWMGLDGCGGRHFHFGWNQEFLENAPL